MEGDAVANNVSQWNLLARLIAEAQRRPKEAGDAEEKEATEKDADEEADAAGKQKLGAQVQEEI